MARKNHRRDFDRARTPPTVGQAGEIPQPVEALAAESSAAHAPSAPADSKSATKEIVGEPASVSGGVPSPRRKRSGAVGGSPTSELEQTLAFVAAVGGFDKAKSLLASAERVAGQVRKMLDA